LVPQMCVDKTPDELVSFHQLKQEASQMGPAWGMVFAAALSGQAGRAPSSEDAEKPLQDMVEAIRLGRLQAFIPFNPQGEAVQLG
ncbi:MAG: ribonucleotide reductase subunit alpha, partial [Hydrogenophaga sp.]|nr:ribonucleotide reductase subunit alpha [Hydrogenophaga sp.]